MCLVVWRAQQNREECLCNAHFPNIQSETRHSFKAPVESQPKKNKASDNNKTNILDLTVSGITFSLEKPFDWSIYGIFNLSPRPLWRGCLSVVRGTWNRSPCPISSVVFLLSPGFSMLLVLHVFLLSPGVSMLLLLKWGLRRGRRGLLTNIIYKQ